ncbi:MAG: hypothetical protein IJQ31_16110 [Thermoguttaceae bacterium]|nr:hypothetical protein [Thermoguttaceae bacterium]
MTGDDLRRLESISCILDDRLVSTHWENNPSLQNVYQENPQSWSFTEPLSIDFAEDIASGGSFTIRFSAKFQISQDNHLVTVNYKTIIPLNVEDTNPAGGTPIRMKAGKDSLINLQYSGSSDAPIDIITEDGATVNIVPSYLQSPMKNEQNLENTYEVDLEPWIDQPIAQTGNPILLLHATLSNGQERFFQIAARQDTILGRSREAYPESNIQASDFVYRFCRVIEKDTDPVAIFLSKRISKNHLSMILSQNGLQLKNSGKNILFQSGSEKYVLDRENPQTTVDLKNLNQSISLYFGGLSGIELKKIFDSDWNGKVEKILQKSNHPKDCFPNTLWKLGKELEVNSIRLTRMPKHSQNCDINTLKKNVDEQYRDSEWWTSDKLASEEEYHLLVRMLTIGNNPIKNAICFRDQNLIERHATLYFCDNHFGLINHSTTAIIYHQYGQENALFQEDCLPLQPGMKFQIGDVRFHVYESYSSYLNILEQNLEANS